MKGAITANDAPFCYLLPAGFLDASATATFPGADPIRTAVAPIGDGHVGAKDLIFVLSTDLSTDSDNLSDALLKAALKKALDAGVPGTTKVTPVVQLSVAGDRAFESDITFTGGAQKRYIIIFSGRHRVSISCQWQTNKAIIASGCAAVLKTLQIANP